MAYFDYYKNVSAEFDVTNPYPNGTLIGRNYRDANDQGHVGIVVEGKVLQSFYPDGVNETFTLIQSHAGGYYEYAVLPINVWKYGRK